jgi:hypothetical protein
MMGTMMDKSSCQWVRGRLPLWMGFDGGASDPGGAGDDLDTADRRSIEAHLAACPACREYRSGLARALEVLDLAAASPPVAPDASSLWPALERRIAARHSPEGSRTACGPGSAAERGRNCSALDDDRPLRSAWMRDTFSEVVEAVGWGSRPVRSGRAGRGRSGPPRRAAGGHWRVVGASLAASILALLVVTPVAWRVRAAAEARIRDNAAPVAMRALPTDPPEAERPDRDEPGPTPVRDIPAGQLAQAEGIKPPAGPPTAADATSGAKPGTPPRVGDLDIGTPMPQDGRDATSVY